MEARELLKKFVEGANVFDGEVHWCPVDVQCSGYAMEDLIHPIDRDQGVAGTGAMGVVPDLENGKDFIAEANLTVEVGMDNPGVAVKSMIDMLLGGAARDMAAFPEELSGPEDGLPCIASKVPIKIGVVTAGECGATDVGIAGQVRMFTVRMLLRCARVEVQHG